MSKYIDGVGGLTEVKRGHVGSGLLVENDGHIFGNCDTIKQIKEDIQHGHQFVCPDHFVVSAIFQKYGIKNANGRVYPESVLRREVSRYIEQCINKRCALGSLDHPEGSTLSGHDISHNILNLEWQDSTLIGEMELHLSPGYRKMGICSTSGDLVANMLLSDYLIGVSSRGLGSVKQVAGGLLVVDDDFDLICWDVVINPSTPGSYIGNKRDELQPYMENETKKGSALNEKLSKIDNILLL